MRSDRFPSWYVIGAYRAGTTSLARYLTAHPRLFLPRRKEPNFWAFRGQPVGSHDRPSRATAIASLDGYLRLYRDAPRDALWGDISPECMISPSAARELASAVPDAKLVAVLRDPVERAYSDYKMYVMSGLERESFLASLQMQSERQRRGAPNGYYISTGLYGEQLQRFLEVFEPGRLRIVLFDDLVTNPEVTLRRLLEWLGAGPPMVGQSLDLLNSSGIPNNPAAVAIARLRSRVPRSLVSRVPPAARDYVNRRMIRTAAPFPDLGRRERAQVLEFFADDLRLLEGLLGISLSHWRSAAR